MRRWQAGGVAAGLAVLGALTFAGIAAADQFQIRHTAAGQAAAKAVVIHRADLGSAPGWKGGPTKQSQSDPDCSTYEPKQSDLVEIGDAESDWENGPVRFFSAATVLRTPAMVSLDWKRSVLDSRVLPCFREVVGKELPKTARIVSARWTAFPRITPQTRALRFVIDVSASTRKVRMFADVVLVGRGRTEITLMAMAPLGDAKSMQAVQGAELRLALLMATRVRM